jgi:hypothetical protein
VIEARLQREQVLEEIDRLGSEAAVRQRLMELNKFIRKAQFSPSAGPADGVAEVDVEAVVAEWKRQREH